MEHDIALILEYVCVNRLKVIADKTKLIRIRPFTRKQGNSFSIRAGQNLILEIE